MSCENIVLYCSAVHEVRPSLSGFVVECMTAHQSTVLFVGILLLELDSV